MSVDDRLRTPPRERLAAPVQHVVLADAIARLRAEPHAATDGHRQVAIVRHAPVSMILFAFDRDGALKEHRTDGEVTIHVLAGRMEVVVGTETLLLGSGALVSLAPGQSHSVRALEASEMLLTVCHHRPQQRPLAQSN